MVIESLFDLLFNFLNTLFSFLPFFDISINVDMIDYYVRIIKSVAFFFPMDTIATLFSITVLVMTFRILVSLVKTLWALIPLL